MLCEIGAERRRGFREKLGRLDDRWERLSHSDHPRR